MSKAKYLCQRGAYYTHPSRTGFDVEEIADTMIRLWRKLGIEQQQALDMLSIWQERHEADLANPFDSISRVYNHALEPHQCNHPIMEKHCLSTCALFQKEAKKLYVKSMHEMVGNLVAEVKKGKHEAANFSSLFRQINYPFYLGEVMVFVGPEKAGKTSFIHNWFLSMKHKPKILNIHLEMSDFSEASRLVQIKNRLKVNASSRMDEVADEIHSGEEFYEMTKEYDFMTFYNASRYSGDIKKVVDNGEYDIVYIDSFDCIQFRGQMYSETHSQKELIAELQHFARINNFFLIITHHQNKQGDAHHITPNSISGVKEIVYQADHIIAFERNKENENLRRLRKIEARRHADLNFTLVGDGDTLTWKLAI